MSYNVWSTSGFGFCVNDIETTPEKILKLASLNENTLNDLREHLNKIYEGSYKDEDLTMEDFDNFEGEYCETGLVAVLREVINAEIPIVWADDFDGFDFILYCPSYPWSLEDKEKNLTKEDVEKIFQKYIKILTGKHVEIDYYNVENGG